MASCSSAAAASFDLTTSNTRLADWPMSQTHIGTERRRSRRFFFLLMTRYSWKMVPRGCFLLVFAVAYVRCLPTMYKYNENRVLEKDLVPVSSTVIPLPIYRVSSVVDGVQPITKGDKLRKPEGPVVLLTASGNKKATLPEKKVSRHVTKKNLGDTRE